MNEEVNERINEVIGAFALHLGAPVLQYDLLQPESILLTSSTRAEVGRVAYMNMFVYVCARVCV